MQPNNNDSVSRIYFFDNIRYLIVLLVVVIHSATSYSSLTPWVPVRDQNAKFFDELILFLDVFLMPTLFFIAGYFALPSLKSKNTWPFIKAKIKRLGIPCLLGVVLYTPIHSYIRIYSRSNLTLDLWDIFLIKMKSALTFHTGFITSHLQFNHSYFWFISLLLLFFILFALLHKAKDKLFVKTSSLVRTETPSSISILLVIFLVGIVIAILSLLIHGYFYKGTNRMPWIMVFNLIQFQPTKIGLYVFSFSLGIYAFHKNWFLNRKIPGHFIIWAMLSVILWYFLRKTMINLLGGFSIQMAVIYIFLNTFLFFSILLTLVSFGVNYWDNSSKANRLFANNSYSIYLMHMIFVRLSQLALFKWWEGLIYFKFIFVCIFSISLSFLFSQYAIKKSPGISAAGLISVFVLLLVLLVPG